MTPLQSYWASGSLFQPSLSNMTQAYSLITSLFNYYKPSLLQAYSWQKLITTYSKTNLKTKKKSRLNYNPCLLQAYWLITAYSKINLNVAGTEPTFLGRWCLLKRCLVLNPHLGHSFDHHLVQQQSFLEGYYPADDLTIPHLHEVIGSDYGRWKQL